MKHWRWTLYFFLCLLVALTAQLPASALAPALASLSQNRLILHETTGSVWTGQARLSLVQDGKTLNLGALGWSIVPVWENGAVQLHVRGNAPGRWQMRIGLSGFGVDIDGPRLPARLFLPALAGKLLSPDWQGEIVIVNARLTGTWNAPPALGKIQAHWLNWGHPGLSPNPLGDLLLTAESGHSGQWQFSLDSRGDSVILRGTGEWNTLSGKKRFRGKILLPETERSRLDPLLRSLGRYQPPTLEIGD